MKLRVLLCLAILVGVFGPAQPGEAQEDQGWEMAAPGIDYKEFVLPGPMRAFVARMQRAEPKVTLESTLGLGKAAYGLETVSSMARRTDQSITYWDGAWGARERVVVAINGSYVIPSSGAPQNGQVQSGWYVKRFDDLGGWSGFAWTSDRTAFIGGCTYHRPEKQTVTFANGAQMLLNGLNRPRGPNELVVYTPQYNDRTLTGAGGVEVLVEMTKPLMVMPLPAGVEGIVREINDGASSSLIPFDAVVLSAAGQAREQLLANLQRGDTIRISQEITSFEPDCSTPMQVSWTKTYASIGGAFVYLKNGAIQSFDDDAGATARHPRTAIAYNDTYVYYIVVDGRNEQWSIGMTITELAMFTQDALGATWGVAQDGGGSSTMVINGKVRNQPSVPCYRLYFPVVPLEREGRPSENSYTQKNRPQEGWPAVCERPVANGMLMVVIEDMNSSHALRPWDEISARSEADLRLGPGSNYAVFASIPQYTRGFVAEHALQGVFAKGSYWWKVTFNGQTGWVAENSIVLYSPQRPDQLRQP